MNMDACDPPREVIVHDDAALTSVRKIHGHWSIQVAHCVSCGRIVIAPQEDTCDCGAEMHPVSKWVQLGKGYLHTEMRGG